MSNGMFCVNPNDTLIIIMIAFENQSIQLQD